MIYIIMELALPFIALSGLYVISNQNNEKPDKKKITKKMQPENFTNMGIRSNLGVKTDNYIPNTDIPPQNYPVTNNKQLADTIGLYPNPNASTDKYFDQNYYEKQENSGVKVGNMPQQIYSLSGDYLDSASFKHNNMVPFNGGKIKGYTYDMNIAETVLDNMAGTGSQVIKKIEQAPLFKPEANMNWAYGAPNQSDFYQSRVNPGSRNNNVKPFETENVGPGLNHGFSPSGSGGFNSGMEARDKWLPKTVDELRTTTNPKLEYNLNNLEGPSYATVKNVGIIGRVEKHTPDGFFINSQDRWLTTTGSEKGEMLRPEQEMGVIRRNNVEVDYTGPASAVEVGVGRAPTAYETSKRQKSETTEPSICSAVGRAPGMDGDKRIGSFKNYNNNRSTSRPVDTMRSGFSAAIGAVIAPFMDVLRPSRKEEVCANIRIYGEVGTAVPSSYVNNPNDITPTTMKETTMYSPQFNINNQSSQQYVDTHTPLEFTQRDSTNYSTYGNVGNNAEAAMDYSAAYRQHNNDIKSQTIGNRANMGGTQMFNQTMNVSLPRQDTNCMDNRPFAPSSIVSLPPAKQNYGHVGTPQQLNTAIEMQRNTPDILNAFRSNPYTHSLTTSV